MSVLLSLPGFRYPYLFDDFDFLGQAQTFRIEKLVPDSSIIFWRPLSREFYFGLVYLAHDLGAVVGHTINALCLGTACLLMLWIGRRLQGPTVGLAAAFLLASFSQVPLLVAWLSGAQDLLAIVFVLLAISLRIERRYVLAAISLLFGLLAKEIAFAFVPVLVFLDWILGRRPYRIILGAALYCVPALAWAAIHPGIRTLLATGLQKTPGGYIGIDVPDRVASMLKSVVTLANLPLSGFRTPLSDLPWGLLLAALMLLGGVCFYLERSPMSQSSETPIPRKRVVLLGLSMFAFPFTMTHAVVRYWAVYYACVQFLGLALVGGTLLSSFTPVRRFATLAAVLCLGFWSRNLVLEPGMPSERNLRSAAIALPQVESGFKALYRSLPRRADLLVSVQSTGSASVYVHLYLFQALRIWYRDPSLVTHRPDFPITGDRPHLLFWVSPDFRVYEVDLATFKNRPRGGAPEFVQYKKTLRYYARGLAVGGDVLRAATILLRIPEQDPVLRSVDARYAAMFFLRNGQTREARAILERVPDLPKELRLAGMGVILTSSPAELMLDDPAFSAFEISPTDRSAILALGRRFARDERWDLASRFGERLLSLDPGNSEALRWIHNARTLPPHVKITQPIREGLDTPFDW